MVFRLVPIGSVLSVAWMMVLSMESVLASSLTTTPIPPAPPISMPVWCLAAPSIIQKDSRTADPEKPFTSMSIVTFATAVSVAPPKLWAVSLYHDTLTKDSFMLNQGGVLQLLTPEQKDLVPILGMRSGYEENYNKEKECEALGYEWVLPTDFSDVELLPRCAAYLHLQVRSTMDAGDHVVALCTLMGTYAYDPEKESIARVVEGSTPRPLDEMTTLYTSLLRQEKIV